jgi:hypothetical protein
MVYSVISGQNMPQKKQKRIIKESLNPAARFPGGAEAEKIRSALFFFRYNCGNVKFFMSIAAQKGGGIRGEKGRILIRHGTCTDQSGTKE